MQARSFDILALLVEHAGEVITKARVLTEIWKGVHVEETSVEKQISLIRKVVGDSPDGRPYIETVPREGYRFLPVVVVEEPPLMKRRVWVAAAVLILSGLGAWVHFTYRKPNTIRRAPAGNRTIAALDLRNLNGSPEQQWLAAAIANMLVADLTATGRLQPVSSEETNRVATELALRSTGSLSRGELSRLAERVQVGFLVTGSYAISQGRLRVDASVFDSRKNQVLAAASEAGRLDDLFEVVSRVGRSLGDKLQDRELSEEELAHLRASTPSDLTSQQLYYQALAFLGSGDALQASKILRKLVEQTPGFALAHSALSEALATLGYETEAAREAKQAWDLSAALGREQALRIEAEYYAAIGDWARTAKTYGTLSSFFPDNVEYAAKLAKAEAKFGNEKDAYSAVAELKRLLADSPGDPRGDFAEASVAEISSDYRREQRAAVEAEKKARQRNAPLEAARAELMESWALDNLGRLLEAAAKAQDAKAVFASFGDRGGEARAWKNLGDAYTDEEKLGAARSAYEKAIALFRSLGWQSGLAIALNNLGYVLKDKGDLSGAGRLFGESLKLARSLGEQRLQALALNGVAIVLSRQGNKMGAQTAYEEALTVHRKLGDKGRLATVLNNLATVLQDQGKLEEARKRLEEALSLFRETNRKIDVAMTLGNLGELDLLEGDLPAAKQRFEEQLTLGEKLPQPKQTAYALLGLGEVELLLGEFNSAGGHIQRSLRMREQMRENATVAETRLALARVELEQSQQERAEIDAQKAKEEFGKEGQADLLASANAILAKALSMQQKTDAAISAAREAEALLASSEDAAVRTQVALDIGTVYEAAGRRREAIQEFRAALNESSSSHFVVYRLEAEIALGRLQAAFGNSSSQILLQKAKAEANRRGLLLIVRQAVMPSTLTISRNR